MTDPYRVLGVSPNATDEEVKAAYRALAKKYHPDAYANNPLADLAAEKMKEINEAYDTIVNTRSQQHSGGGSQRGGYSGGYGSYGYAGSGSSSQFADIRRLIQMRRVAQAEELLDGIPEPRRDAEWHFLKGSIYYSRGWLDEAMASFSRACEMNPQNPEYRAAYNQLAFQRNTGRAGGYQQQGAPMMAGCTPCDACSGLICADCCCECFGGDLISCC